MIPRKAVNSLESLQLHYGAVGYIAGTIGTTPIALQSLLAAK
jgi:hypothetical protein